MKRLVKLLYPPLWLMLLLALLSTAGLILVFSRSLEEHPVAYGVYVLSAYALTVLCIFVVQYLPGKYRRAREKLHAHPYGNKYLTDVSYKARVSLYISLSINLLYAGMKLVMGLLYGSLWLGALAVYYLLLSALRFIPLRYMRRTRGQSVDLRAEYRQLRLCAILLLVLNLSLTGIVAPMIVQGRSAAYPGFLIFAVAAYTFYSVTASVIDLVRYRRQERPVIAAAKAIRFAAALVSLLSLEAAMLTQFGEDGVFRRLMLGLTGAAVCAIMLAISIIMLLRAAGALHHRKH
ncbi:MAG: hypothetical protein IJ357_00295 [Oscillospiraceae bacterium]|nr:hypothetical protein [Oscillospiraceae bacterium]